MPTHKSLLPKGIYTHIQVTASAGTIPVIAVSAGEAPHLSASECVILIQTVRKAQDDAGLAAVPIVVGVGAPNTRETVELVVQVADAVADFAMVIPPGYYSGGLRGDEGEALRLFFGDVPERSPLPDVIHNFPGVPGGIDLDSDFIVY